MDGMKDEMKGMKGEIKEKQKVVLQEIKVRGNQLVDKVRDVLEEGNARRIIIKKDGRSVMEFPLSVGVGGAAAAILLSPTLAAIGAFASLASDVQLVIERHVEPATPEDTELIAPATPPPPPEPSA